MGRHSIPEIAPNRLPFPQFDPHSRAVGAAAINAADVAMWHGAHSQNAGDYHAQQAQHATERLHSQLAIEQKQLLTLPFGQKTRLAGHAQVLLVEYVEDGEPPSAHFIDTIAGSNKLTLKFLRRNDIVVKEQQAHIPEVIAEPSRKYVEGTLKGISERWINRDAEDIADDIKTMKVVVDDFWHSHRLKKGGAYEREPHRILLPQGLGFSPEKRLADLAWRTEAVFAHEANHWKYYRKMPGELLWIEEAMAEHVQLAMKNGDPLVIDPKIRQDSHQYTGYRSLMHFIHKHAPGGPISPLYATLAYTSNSLTSPAWRKFEEKIDAGWGIDRALWKISECVTEYTRHYQKYRAAAEWYRAADDAAYMTMQRLGLTLAKVGREVKE